VATALALAVAAPLSAHEDQRCIDEACDLQRLFADDTGPGGGSGASIEAQRLGKWGIDTAGMQPEVRPGEDFFAYVNGNWARTTQIPADRSSYGGFAILRDLSEARLRKLVESYPQGDTASGGDAPKIAALYRGFMDEAAVESLGAKPLQPLLAAIGDARDKAAIAALRGRRNGTFGGSFFAPSVSDDQKDPDRYTLYLSQSGLGLGDRQLYLEEKFAPQRERYVAYLEQMLTLAGSKNAKKQAADVMAMETRIAEAHWTRAESRDRDKTYNPVPMAEMAAYAPGFAWADYFRAAGVEQSPRVVLRKNVALAAEIADGWLPIFFAPGRFAETYGSAFASTDLDTLKAWLVFHTTDDAAPLLSKAFVDAEFEFRSKFLNGQPQPRERWKRGVALAEGAMGEAIGRDYVKLYYPPDAKAKMDALVANVKAAMGARLEQLAWMSPATKAEAKAKLQNFGLKIGHPEKWRDYAALEVRNGDLFGNAQRARVRMGLPPQAYRPAGR